MHRLLFICFPIVLRHACLSARQNIKSVSTLSYVVADLAGVRLVQDKAEAKVAALEARSEKQRKERAQAEAEWRRQQRDRELKCAQEEIEREKEARPCCFAQHFLLHVLCLVPCAKYWQQANCMPSTVMHLWRLPRSCFVGSVCIALWAVWPLKLWLRYK